MRFAWWTVCLIFLCAFLAAFFAEMAPSYVFVTGVLILLNLFLIVFGENIKIFSLGFGDATLQLEKVVHEASAVADRLERVLNESKNYWSCISEDQAKQGQPNELLVEPIHNSNCWELIVKFESQLDAYDSAATKVSSTLSDRWSDTIKFMRKVGVDLAEVEKIPYYENPLHSTRTFDMTSLMIPNNQIRTRQLFCQMVIKFLEEVEQARELTPDETSLKERFKKTYKDKAMEYLVD